MLSLQASILLIRQFTLFLLFCLPKHSIAKCFLILLTSKMLFWGKEKENGLSYLAIHHDATRKHEGFVDNTIQQQRQRAGQKVTEPCWVWKAGGTYLPSLGCGDRVITYTSQPCGWGTNCGCIFTRLITAELHKMTVQCLSFHSCVAWMRILAITFHVCFDAKIYKEVF